MKYNLNLNLLWVDEREVEVPLLPGVEVFLLMVLDPAPTHLHGEVVVLPDPGL